MGTVGGFRLDPGGGHFGGKGPPYGGVWMGGGISSGCGVFTDHTFLLAVGVASRPCLSGSAAVGSAGVRPWGVQVAETLVVIPDHVEEDFPSSLCLLDSLSIFPF